MTQSNNSHWPQPQTSAPGLLVESVFEELSGVQQALARIEQAAVQGATAYARVVKELDQVRSQPDLSAEAQAYLDEFTEIVLARAGLNMLAVIRAEARRAGRAVDQPIYFIT